MVINIIGAVLLVMNPRIAAFIVKHGNHVEEGQKIKHNIDELFAGRYWSQLTCPGCGKQKEFRLHGFGAIDAFVDDLMGKKK